MCAVLIAGAIGIAGTGGSPAIAGAATAPVSSPPVSESDFGPVADWGTTTGTDGRVYFSDQNGRALQFHGFNLKTNDPSARITDALLDQAAARGVDHYRMTIYWQLLEPTEGHFDEGYLDNVVNAINRCAAHGIRVILDMHQDVYGEAFDSMGIPAWATKTDPGDPPFVAQPSWLLDYLQPAVQSAFDNLYNDPSLRQAQIDAWMHVVNRVKDLPGVIGYDLLNEPFGKISDLAPGETIFDAAARIERTQLTPMYQRLTDAISAVDPAHWVFIEPPNLASLGIATSMGQVTGPKVAFYPHMYDTALETATYSPGLPYTYDPAFFTQWADAITQYVARYPMPLLVGEWGIAQPDAPSMKGFVQDSLSMLDKVSSGWTQFQFCEGSGYCSVDGEGNDRPNIGQIFQPYARAIAGAPTSSSYDFTSKVLTVTFRDNSATGPTEIFIPQSRAYPDGFTVGSGDVSTSWSNSFDAATGVLSVTLPHTGGDHTICVAPSGTVTPGCAATQEPTTTAPPETTPPSTVAPPTTPTSTVVPRTTRPTAPMPPARFAPPTAAAVAVNADPTYTG